MKPHSKTVYYRAKKVKPSLSRYLEQHIERARKMGVLNEFLSARTITEAKRIVFPKKGK